MESCCESATEFDETLAFLALSVIRDDFFAHFIQQRLASGLEVFPNKNHGAGWCVHRVRKRAIFIELESLGRDLGQTAEFGGDRLRA